MEAEFFIYLKDENGVKDAESFPHLASPFRFAASAVR